MPRAMKLKVFRIPIGFHDAYVAAPSQKAAIEAWGSDADVFRRGEAELVTDPKLTKGPLARPGEIVKRLRGTAAEQIAALGDADLPAPRRAKGEAKVRPRTRPEPKPSPKPKPRPSRAALDEAEQALADANERHSVQLDEIAEREAALARERQALETKQRRQRERLEARRDKAEAAHPEAMRRWREG